jgi:YesN/AraC family two-component response regulator
MIVDDEPLIRVGINISLSKYASFVKVVAEADNGERALSYILQHPGNVDCILTDIKMPVLDGIGLISKVHDRFPDIKIIVLSSYNDLEYVKSAILNGASDYLLKHEIDEENIIRPIEKLFGARTEELPNKSSRSAEDVMIRYLEGELEEQPPDFYELFNGGKKIVIAVFRVLNAEAIIEKNYKDRRQLMEMAVANILQEHLFKQSECKRLAYHKEFFVMFYEYESDRGRYYINEIEFAGMLLKKYMNLSVNIGVSKEICRPTELREAYAQAMTACAACFYNDKDKNDCMEFSALNFEAIMPLLNACDAQFASLLTDNDYHGMGAFFEKFFAEARRYTGTDPKRTKDKLRDYLIKLESKTGMESSLFLLENNELMEVIEEAETIGEIQSSLKRALNLNTDNGSAGRTNSQPIKNAIKLIRNQFSNPELHLEFVANSIGWHPAYFSRLFKKEVGKGFV